MTWKSQDIVVVTLSTNRTLEKNCGDLCVQTNTVFGGSKQHSLEVGDFG